MVGIFDKHVLKGPNIYQSTDQVFKKMKTKKNIAEKSAESQCDNIYMYRINTYLNDYDVNVIFADLNEVLNDGTTYISKCCVLFLIIN